MKKLNKNDTTNYFRSLKYDVKEVKKEQNCSCTRLEMQSIAFPKWNDFNLENLMFRQGMIAKDQPEGRIYDRSTFKPEGKMYDEFPFQAVLHIIRGKVYINGQLDCYNKNPNKVTDYKNIQMIGTNSTVALMNLYSILNTVTDATEKFMVADMFTNLNRDLLLITTPAEKREYMEITTNMYLHEKNQYCVDEWMNTDKNGEAEATRIHNGDFLIFSNSGLYRIAREEFFITHVLD